MSHTERIGAFVVTYRRPHILAETLRAITTQTRSVDSVVVLDNDPELDTAKEVAAQFPGVIVTALDSNTGSAGGFATALRLAREWELKWAWLFDDDAAPHQNALEELLRGAHPDGDRAEFVGMLAPLQESSRSVFGVSRWRNRLIQLPVSHANGTEPYSVDVTSWAGLLVHRNVIDTIGYPRGEFFRCYADYEYCLRARAAGVRILAVPMARVRHDSGNPRVIIRFGRPSLRLDYSPLRNYYHARNAAFTAAYTLRSPVASVLHLLRQLRLSMGDIIYGDQRLRRVHLRFIGVADGFRQRLGPRWDLE